MQASVSVSDITIYHNPQCSKSCEALQILQDQDSPVRVVDYLKDPPTIEELDQICTDLNLQPVQLVRTTESRFRELGLSTGSDRSRRDWLTIMVDNPILIQRPIVVNGRRVVIGRPPDAIREIL